MNRPTARNLGLLLLTALLFVGLALSLSESLQPITPAARQLSGPQPQSASDTQQAQQFALRLDKSLQTPITSTPTANRGNRVLAPITSRALKLREPEFRKPLLFLTGALALGLISGIGFNRRARVVSAAADPVRPHPHSVSPPLDAMEKSELANKNQQLTTEVQSLRENLQSYVGISEFAETLQLQQQETAQEKLELKNQIEQLQSHLQIAEDAKDATEKLRAQLEQAQQQNTELEAQILTLSNNMQEHIAAAEDTEHLRKLNEQTSAQNAELLAEVQTLRDNLHSYKNEIDNTENRLKDHEVTIEELRDELQGADELASVIQSTKQKQQELVDEISERDEIISNLHADIDNWRDQNVSHEAHAIEINDQLMLTREEKERSTRDLTAAEELIHELQQSKETLINQIDHLEPRAALADDLGVQIGNLEISSKRSQSEFEHLQETLLETQLVADESTRLQSRLNTMIEDLESAENAHAEAEQQIQSMQQQHRNLELANSEKDNQLSQLSVTIDQRDSTISQLSEDSEAQQEQLEKVTHVHQALSVEHQTLFDNHEQLSGKQQKLNNELNVLKTILEETEQSNIELSDSIVLLREDLTNMANQVNERNALINEGKKQLASEMHHATAREQIIDDLNAQLENEEQRIESMSESIAHAATTQERLNNWDNSIQTFRSDIAKKNGLIDQLHDTIHINNIRNNALKDQIRSMDEQMEDFSDVREEVAQVTANLSAIDELLGVQDTGISAISVDTSAQFEKIASLDQTVTQMQLEKSQWQVRLEDSANATAELQHELLDNQQAFLNLGNLLDQTMQSADIESVDENAQQGADLATQLWQKTQIVSDHLSGSLNAIQITINEHNILHSQFEEQVELNNLQRAEAEKAQQRMTDLGQELEDKQTAIDAQINQHVADTKQYSARQVELENKIDELSATLKSDQDTFATRQLELQQKIEEHAERELLKDREFGVQLQDKEQEAQHTSTLLGSEQEKTTAYTQEIQDLNNALAFEREQSATHEQELQRLNELLVAEKETFSTHQINSEQELITLRSSQDALQLEQEKQSIEQQNEFNKLQIEARDLEAQIESNQNEFELRLKTHSEQLRSELENQRDALLEESKVYQQQLTGELLEQKEANGQLFKEIEAQREQIRQLKPTAQALPVLRNLVSGGKKDDHVPVLRQPKNKKL